MLSVFGPNPSLQEPHGAQEPAASHGEGDFDLGEMLSHHIVDGPEYDLPFFGYVHLPELPSFCLGGRGADGACPGWLTVDLSLSKHVVLLVLAAMITFVLVMIAARAIRRGGTERAPTGIANAIEAVVLFLRDDLCKEYIGHGYRKFVPLILTLFFYILVMNLLGLVPWGGSATGNLAVTATLAVIVFLVTEIGGFIKLGPGGYLRTIFFVPPGTSGPLKYVMLAIMTPVELMGKFTKPFALAVRLFANMTAGHILIFTFIGFTILFGGSADGSTPGQLAVPFGGRWFIAGASYAFVSAVLLLELLIAFIQAYIFAVLSAVFIGLMQHEH